MPCHLTSYAREVFDRLKSEKSLNVSSNSFALEEPMEELQPMLQIEGGQYAATNTGNHSCYSIRIERGGEKELDLVTSKVTAILKEKSSMTNAQAIEFEEKIKMPLHFTDKFAGEGKCYAGTCLTLSARIDRVQLLDRLHHQIRVRTKLSRARGHR